MNCDAASLIEAAKCLLFPQGRTRAIWIYLLCKWADPCTRLPSTQTYDASVNTLDYTDIECVTTIVAQGDPFSINCVNTSTLKHIEASCGSCLGVNANGNAALESIEFPNAATVQLILSALNILNNPKLTLVDFSSLATMVFGGANRVNIQSNAILPALNLPSLWTSNDIYIRDLPLMTTLNLNNLHSTTGYIAIGYCASLASMSFPALNAIGEDFFFENNTACTTLDMGHCPDIYGTFGTVHFSGNGCTKLASVLMTNLAFPNNSHVTFVGCALTVTSVDHILSRCVASGGFVTGEVDLSGGTNAAPSSIAPGSDTAVLIARGVTVTHN